MNVGSDLVKAAIAADCDFIVMASHMPSLKDHILTSNAGYVASHAPMTVYLVR
jgi:nucleotide-binding universal stress UspA family protein